LKKSSGDVAGLLFLFLLRFGRVAPRKLCAARVLQRGNYSGYPNAAVAMLQPGLRDPALLIGGGGILLGHVSSLELLCRSIRAPSFRNAAALACRASAAEMRNKLSAVVTFKLPAGFHWFGRWLG
jgi:hypothetical protein